MSALHDIGALDTALCHPERTAMTESTFHPAPARSTRLPQGAAAWPAFFVLAGRGHHVVVFGGSEASAQLTGWPVVD